MRWVSSHHSANWFFTHHKNASSFSSSPPFCGILFITLWLRIQILSRIDGRRENVVQISGYTPCTTYNALCGGWWWWCAKNAATRRSVTLQLAVGGYAERGGGAHKGRVLLRLVSAAGALRDWWCARGWWRAVRHASNDTWEKICLEVLNERWFELVFTDLLRRTGHIDQHALIGCIFQFVRVLVRVDA